MPELLDVFVYNEVENGATAAEIATLLNMPQREVWERMEAARFSAELRQLREGIAGGGTPARQNGRHLRQT